MEVKRINILAIDPGPDESAFVFTDGEHVSKRGKIPNEKLMAIIKDNPWCEAIVAEQVACYGKPVGKEVFETVFWTGRFCEASPRPFHRLERRIVKMHLCHETKGVNDAVIRQALIDRFGPGKDAAIGTKKQPGPLFGITKDQWQALALAVTFLDQNAGKRVAV
jgi:hypothetical protein